jgi:ATP-dependent HslUV protease ATP-binding subunit HslU
MRNARWRSRCANRWRRAQVAEPLRAEITPKNILMIGPTGVGKTEIARRLARLANAPFIKVEATKFTEVGYVGRDVDSIIRDLAPRSRSSRCASRRCRRCRPRGQECSRRSACLDTLLPGCSLPPKANDANSTRQRFRKMLREGKLDDKEIEVDVAQSPGQHGNPRAAGMEELTQQIQGMIANMGGTRASAARSRSARRCGCSPTRKR